MDHVPSMGSLVLNLSKGINAISGVVFIGIKVMVRIKSLETVIFYYLLGKSVKG